MVRQAHNLDTAGFNSRRPCNQTSMPTYRVTNRETGEVLLPAVQADSEFSAISGQPGDPVATQISPNPPAAVFTVAWPQETARGVELVEVMSTGSRATAQDELRKQPPGRSMIEETPAANRIGGKSRRS